MKSHLEWCRKQRRGLKLATPEKGLAEAFVKKAKNALIMLKCAKDKDLPDWIATTSYYAKYFALYALFVKCGIKCEIHDCTILAMKELFVDTGMLDKGLYNDISNSKGLRVDLQYYTYNKPYRSRAIESADSQPLSSSPHSRTSQSASPASTSPISAHRSGSHSDNPSAHQPADTLERASPRSFKSP